MKHHVFNPIYARAQIHRQWKVAAHQTENATRRGFPCFPTHIFYASRLRDSIGNDVSCAMGMKVLEIEENDGDGEDGEDVDKTQRREIR